MPESFLEDSNNWTLWCTHYMETLLWWLELWEVPNQTDTPQFPRRVWASFQMPKVRCHPSKAKNDYSVLPTPHCIVRDAFLPFNNMQFSSQDYYMKQPQKTWHMPRCCNIGWGRPDCQCQVSHANWWSVCRYLGKLWSLWWCLNMLKFLEMRCLHTGWK